MSVTYHGFSVPFRFPVAFTRGVWRPDNPLLALALQSSEPGRRHRALVLVDDKVACAHPLLLDDIEAYFAGREETLELAGPPLLVPGGEAVKNDLSPLFEILERVNAVGLDRQSFIIVIGGGAVLDMASFAAGIAHRGVRVVRLPTTTLSQGDSGVAVKNSLNLFGKKNFIGSFVPPFAVINDFDFLATLETRDRVAGISEAIKVALLRDPMLFSYIETHVRALEEGDQDVLAKVVQRSAELHLAHICGNGDPFELGSARPLDFGHWAAHKLEALTAYRLRHGEAVAIGMALDLTYARLAGHLSDVCCERVLRLIERTGLPVYDEALLERTAGGRYALLGGLQEFREHLGGELHITLIRTIGQCFEVTEMNEALVCQAIAALERRAVAPVAAAITSH